MRINRTNSKKGSRRNQRGGQRPLARFVERKVYTQAFSQNPTNTGNVVSLCNVLQGTDIQNRIGRHIRAMKVNYVVNSTAVTATAGYSDTVSTYFFLDTACPGTVPAVADVLDTTIGVAAALQVLSKNEKRFKLLRVVDHPLSASGPATMQVRGSFQIPTAHQIFEYVGAGTSYPSTNGIFMLVGSIASSTGNYSEILAQLVFEDM